MQFTATSHLLVEGELTWLVKGVVGGSTGSGTISHSGLYNAPQLVAANTQAIIGVTSVRSTPVALAGTIDPLRVGSKLKCPVFVAREMSGFKASIAT